MLEYLWYTLAATLAGVGTGLVGLFDLPHIAVAAILLALQCCP